MRALVAGGNGFKLLSQVLIIMLQTLLQDRLAEVAILCHLLISRSHDLRHLKISLHRFPTAVTCFTDRYNRYPMVTTG